MGPLAGRGAAAVFGLLLLFGCSAVPVPATQWLRLSSEPAATAPAAPSASTAPGASGGPAVTAAPAAPTEVWQLMGPVPLPGHLDRDSIFVPQGVSGAWVRPLANARWVEPLRDAVPRLLREDLSRQMGGMPLWWAPLPPGLVPTRQLRVEITALEVSADGRALVLQARWSTADARGTRAPAVHAAAFNTSVAASAEPEAWAVAHRQAIAALAMRISATMLAP